MLSRILGKPIPSGIVRLVYALAFAVWLFCLAGGPLGVSAEIYFTHRHNIYSHTWTVVGLFAVFGALCLFTWQRTLRRLVRTHRAERVMAVLWQTILRDAFRLDNRVDGLQHSDTLAYSTLELGLLPRFRLKPLDSTGG